MGKTLKVGSSVYDVLAPEIHDYMETAFKKVLEGFSLERKSKHIGFDGKEYWIRGYYNPVKSTDGTIIGICMGVSDITAETIAADELEKQVEERTRKLKEKNNDLKQQKEFTEVIFDSSIDSISVIDTEMRYVSVNKKFVEAVGRKKEDILGKKVTEVFPEVANSPSLENFKKAFRGESSHHISGISIVNGRSYESFFVPLYHDNTIYACLAVGHDTTSLTEASKKLLEYNAALEEKNIQLIESEERYQKMVDEVQDYAIFLLDKNGIIQNWNRGSERIKGYKAEEIIGQHFRIFYSARDQKNHLPEQLLEIAISTGKVANEGWRIRKDGTTFWASSVLTALHGENNEIIGFTKVTRVLTMQKLAEDALRENAETLQQKNEDLLRQNEFIETLIDNSVDLIGVYDKNLRLISINKKSLDFVKGKK
jgi:PAS domain S-box-containing protein